jgi:plastocyanin
MKRIGLTAAAILAAWPALASPAGRIEGTVTLLDGGRARADASDVVVWVDGVKLRSEKSADAPEMKSFHKSFVPRVLGVEVGEPVAFPNEDPIFHNVFSVSGANRFDLGLYRRGRSKEKTFDEPGLVRVYCNIHPQMVGYIRVVDSSLHGVTGPSGEFAFSPVPEGARTVRAWCEQGGETSVPALVRAGRTTRVALSIDVSGYRPQTHKNKYGKDYPPPPPDEDRY